MKSDYSCEAYRSWKSAEYGLTWFGVIKLYLRVIHDQFFEFRVSSTSGHPFKLYKRYNSCRIRSLFSTERVTNIWNKLPVSITDFRTLSSFKKSLHMIDLTDLLADGWLLDCFVSRFNYVCLFCFFLCQLLGHYQLACCTCLYRTSFVKFTYLWRSKWMNEWMTCVKNGR